MKSLIIIPARMASSRFPNKPVALIKGRSMIERVWQIAKRVSSADAVYIATDSNTLADFVKNFGAKVIMTPSTCETGTDRVALAYEALNQPYDIIFSLQGDAVLTPPWIIETILNKMQNDPAINIATPAVCLTGLSLINFVAQKKQGNSSGTLVTFDKKNNALYFSKALIPFSRTPTDPSYSVYRHIGLYAYRPGALKQFLSLPMGKFEAIEQLEPLRALEHNLPIRVVLVDYKGRTHGSVDRSEDVAIVEKIIEQEGELVL